MCESMWLVPSRVWLVTNRAETSYNEAMSLPRERPPVSSLTHCHSLTLAGDTSFLFALQISGLLPSPQLSIRTPCLSSWCSLMWSLGHNLGPGQAFISTSLMVSCLSVLSAVLWGSPRSPRFVPYLMPSHCLTGPRSRQRVCSHASYLGHLFNSLIQNDFSFVTFCTFNIGFCPCWHPKQPR